MTSSETPVFIARSLFVLSAIVLASDIACQLTGTPPPATPTRSDRLMQVYPELRGGRFAVIADFEDPVHMELVHLHAVSPGAATILDLRGGRPETGKSCLKLTRASANDAVVLGDDRATGWHLKRDWRDYDVFQMAVHVPRPQLTLELALTAEVAGKPAWAESSWPLEPGWNLIQVDLAAVGDHLPLDDVRNIRLAVAGPTGPMDVRFDDVILTSSREDLFGDSRNRQGELYIQRVGRRWNVGAGGRFELTFANGQIVGWYNLADDPYRLRNLVRGSTLGPSPVAMDSTGVAPKDSDPPGGMVITRPQIVEMNAVRAVVTSEWRLVDEPHQSLDDRPYQRWRYTIYRTGQLYVTVECSAGDARWFDSPLGLAVTMNASPEDRSYVPPGDAVPHDGHAESAAYGWMENASANASLVFALSEPQPATRIVRFHDQQRQRQSLIAVGTDPAAGSYRWQCLLALDTARNVQQHDCAARALAYARPRVLTFEVGSAETYPGAIHGYNPGSGIYLIRPDSGQARFWIDGDEHPIFSPTFEIADSADCEVWVYVNHLVFTNTARNAHGDMIFQLTNPMRERTLVEVLFRRTSQPGGA